MIMTKNKKIKMLEHELGRWQKKVGTQQQEIDKLQQQLAAAQLGNDMSEAFVALILQRCGADREHPVQVTTKEVGEAVENRRRAVMQVGEDSVISMWSETRCEA